MVLVVRGEIRLTAGKAAVQVAHAALSLVESLKGRQADRLAPWRAQGQRKIALTAETLDDLERLERAARSRGLPTAMVEDAGLTEVPPGTKTVLGIGPGTSAEIDPVTGELDLL